MNWQHLQAFVWLRWRLLVNQWRRGGALNLVLMMILMIGAMVTAVPLFLGSIALGLYAIPKAAPEHLMYAWDVLVVAFLFFWCIGLMIDLQRADPFSLSMFLHLPVSVRWAFLINYFSSLLRLSLIIFVPMMLGFCVALVMTKGLLLLAAPVLLVAFLLMVTALTYQFQGWLAALMSNPRRRRTVIVVATASFILIVQLPNLLNVYAPWQSRLGADRSRDLAAESAKLRAAFAAHEINAEQLMRRQEELIAKFKAAQQQANREMLDQLRQITSLINAVVPIGWLPLGVMTAAEGNVTASILPLLGMALIGSVSLHRAYRTTIRIYQGEPSNQQARPVPAVARPVAARKAGSLFLEARLPGLSEPVSAIALGGLRSLVRSPEAKMMLLTDLIMIPIFGSMVFKGNQSMPVSTRPLVAIGGMVMVLFGVVQFMANQFGFDRDGFRVFVLSSARRRDILLGKNLAIAPVTLGLAGFVLLIVQVVCPLRLDHFLAMFPQYVSMFLLFCMVMNLLSIYAPVYVPAGSFKAPNPKLTVVLLQLLTMMVLFPLTQAVSLIPLGAEMLMGLLGSSSGVPIYLLLSLAECAVLVLIYHFMLNVQGSLFQASEQWILERVTNRAT